jgi:hypothetical protein
MTGTLFAPCWRWRSASGATYLDAAGGADRNQTNERVLDELDSVGSARLRKVGSMRSRLRSGRNVIRRCSRPGCIVRACSSPAITCDHALAKSSRWPPCHSTPMSSESSRDRTAKALSLHTARSYEPCARLLCRAYEATVCGYCNDRPSWYKDGGTAGCASRCGKGAPPSPFDRHGRLFSALTARSPQQSLTRFAADWFVSGHRRSRLQQLDSGPCEHAWKRSNVAQRRPYWP